MAESNPLRRLITVIWGDWQSNALWQRIIKYSIACVVAIIIAILPRFKANSTFLTPMVTVFAHPGQRMGLMIESLLMILIGSLLGLSWSLLGLYLSSLVEESNKPAAYTIRALFLLVCVLFHGFVRSSSPRLFNFVLFLLVAALLTIQLPSHSTTSLFTTIYVPILLGGGVLIVTNLAIFPELSSSFLGSSTIDTLSATVDTLSRATHWFITPGADSPEAKDGTHALAATTTGKSHRSTVSRVTISVKRGLLKFWAGFPNPFKVGPGLSTSLGVPIECTTLAQLTGQKSRLRAQLSRCKTAQDEVNFEISLSSLPPMSMKPISVKYMTGLVQSIVTLIGACENKFILVGNDDWDVAPDAGGKQPVSITPDIQIGLAQRTQPIASPQSKNRTRHKDKIDKLKPLREIEAGSSQLLESMLRHIRSPVQDFQTSMKEAVDLLTVCLAFCFDVRYLPSGTPTPKGISLEEIDLRIDQFANALTTFDSESAHELKQAAMDNTGEAVDFMPRMETFLVSSFILAFRDSATQILQMLRHARTLVERRQERHSYSRIWFPHYENLRKWLTTGGEVDGMVLHEGAKKAARQGQLTSTNNDGTESPTTGTSTPLTGTDVEALPAYSQQQQPEKTSANPAKPGRRKGRSGVSGPIARFRQNAANALEWAQNSEDVSYALKLAIAVFLVTWPAFISSWNAWYTEVRGVWAPMQLILVFEVAIGTSLFVFALRLFGVLFGCVVGYLAVEISRSHRAAVVVILIFGVVPSVYVQLGTKYVKAAMISIVSMAVVALAAVNRTSSAYEIFYKRLVAFLVGGLFAMLVEALIMPVRARDRLVESLSASVRQVQRMQAAVAVGIDNPEKPNFRSKKLFNRFTHSREKAQMALAAAETFLPFCLTEPRLKGSFRPLAPIYKEIIYVLHQIIDRMDNVVQLRRAYGSSVLEDLNPKVYTYRRDVAASCTLILFSVNEALTTWLPLPQFIPSPRLPQLRLINRVRELLIPQNSKGSKADPLNFRRGSSLLDEQTANMITQRKFLSWNASSAGQMEIIEYLEELVALVKMLVGVNAFRGGLLERPQYRQYIRQLETEGKDGDEPDEGAEDGEDRERQASGVSDPAPGPSLRRAATVAQPQSSAARSRPEQVPDVEAQEEKGRGDEEAEEIPRSLERVATRLRRDNNMVRRRAFTVGR